MKNNNFMEILMELVDKNGKEIKLGHELNVPLDVFSNGIVVLNEDDELSLELRYESKKIPLRNFSENFLSTVEII